MCFPIQALVSSQCLPDRTDGIVRRIFAEMVEHMLITVTFIHEEATGIHVMHSPGTCVKCPLGRRMPSSMYPVLFRTGSQLRITQYCYDRTLEWSNKRSGVWTPRRWSRELRDVNMGPNLVAKSLSCSNESLDQGEELGEQEHRRG
jgi:hypothetical protein